MKKEYTIPMAEKLEFNYSETITASGHGSASWLHTDNYNNCHDTPSDPPIWIAGDSDESCRIDKSFKFD